jgi:hypothetical protein
VLVVRMLGLGLALLLVAGGAVGVITQFFRQSADMSTTLAGTVLQVIARTDIGDVFVRQGGPGQPLVVRRVLHWSFDRPNEEVTRHGDTVSVAGQCRHRAVSFGDCSVDLDITLPPGAAVRIDTGTGDVGADGVAATIEATTGRGDISLHGLRCADVTATTGTGDVTVAMVTAPTAVQARTSTGDLRLIVPADGAGYRIVAHTAVGSRTVRLPTDANSSRTITATTAVGDLTLVTSP